LAGVGLAACSRAAWSGCIKTGASDASSRHAAANRLKSSGLHNWLEAAKKL